MSFNFLTAGSDLPLATFGQIETKVQLQKKLKFQNENAFRLFEKGKVDAIALGCESVSDLEAQSYKPRQIWNTSELDLATIASRSDADYFLIKEKNFVLSPVALYVLLDAVDSKKEEVIFGNLIDISGPDPELIYFSRCSELSSEFTTRSRGYALVHRSFLKDLESILFSKIISAKQVPLFLGYQTSVFKSNTVAPKVFFEKNTASVSIIICFKDKPEMTLECVAKACVAFSGIDYEILLVNNNSNAKSTQLILQGARTNARIKIIDYPHPFNFNGMHNDVIGMYAKHEILFLLNNDVMLPENFEVQDLVNWVLKPRVGVVSFRLNYPNGKLQYGGIGFLKQDLFHPDRITNIQDEKVGNVSREVIAVSFAAAMMRKSVFDDVGGFDATVCANGFGDVEFCLKAREKKYHHVYLSHISALHLESVSRGRADEFWEASTIFSRYSWAKECFKNFDNRVVPLLSVNDQIWTAIIYQCICFIKASTPRIFQKLRHFMKKVRGNLLIMF